MGLGAIPWTAVIQYAQIYRLDPDLTEVFCDVIRAMDKVYLEWEAEEAEKRRKANT